MAIPVLDIDIEEAAARTAGELMHFGDRMQKIVAEAIATERERCAQIAESIDSGRGNEKEIVKAIRVVKALKGERT